MLSHAGILVADGATSQNLGTTPAALTCFTIDQQSDSLDYGDAAMQPDAANDRVLVKRPGRYRASFALCGQVPAADDTYKFWLGKNGVRQTQIVTDLDGDGTNVALNVAAAGFITVTEADIAAGSGSCAITVIGEAGDTRAVTIRFGQLNVLRLQE